MKAVKIVGPGKVTVTEVPVPEPRPGEVLLKVNYVGFCGSDLSTYLGKNPLVSYPRIPGHEVSAVVAETNVSLPDGLLPGDRVTVIPYTSCGKCAACRNGRFNACEHNQTLGVQRDGAMCGYISVPVGKILKVPHLSDTETALIEPLTVGFHAIDRARVTAEDTVMVLGSGMIGAGAVAGAAQRGAKVIAVDIDDEKLETVKKAGAAFVINSSKVNLHEELMRITSDNAPDVVVEAAGNPVTYRAGMEELAFTGRMVCIGYTKNETSFPTSLWVKKELDILGSRNAIPGDFKAVIGLLESGKFPAAEVLTRVVSFDEAPDAFKKWSEDPGKVFKILLKL